MGTVVDRNMVCELIYNRHNSLIAYYFLIVDTLEQLYSYIFV